MRSLLLAVLATAGVLAGCRGETSRERPVLGIRNMFDQGKYNMQTASEFFEDGRSMRPLPIGVVAHDEEVDPRVALGLLEDGTGYVLTLPQETVDRAGGMGPMLKRGQDRYNVYCSMCHGESGSGEGVVKERAIAAGAAAFVPANLHDERLRHIPDGQLFATITHGKGNMAPYGYALPVQDRWDIVAYVRALQLAAPKVEMPKTAEPAPAPAPTPSTTASGEPAPVPSAEASAAASASVEPAPSAAPSASAPTAASAPAPSAAPASSNAAEEN